MEEVVNHSCGFTTRHNFRVAPVKDLQITLWLKKSVNKTFICKELRHIVNSPSNNKRKLSRLLQNVYQWFSLFWKEKETTDAQLPRDHQQQIFAGLPMPLP